MSSPRLQGSHLNSSIKRLTSKVIRDGLGPLYVMGLNHLNNNSSLIIRSCARLYHPFLDQHFSLLLLRHATLQSAEESTPKSPSFLHFRSNQPLLSTPSRPPKTHISPSLNSIHQKRRNLLANFWSSFGFVSHPLP